MRFFGLIAAAVLAFFCTASQAAIFRLEGVTRGSSPGAPIETIGTITGWFQIDGPFEETNTVVDYEIHFNDLNGNMRGWVGPTIDGGAPDVLKYTADSHSGINTGVYMYTPVTGISLQIPAGAGVLIEQRKIAITSMMTYVSGYGETAFGGWLTVDNNKPAPTYSQPTSTVPEPSAWLTLLAGMAMLVWFLGRRMA
jgi:hypothetical protein